MLFFTNILPSADTQAPSPPHASKHSLSFSLSYRVTFFREPSTSFVRRYLERQDAAKGSINHPFVGFSDPKAKDGTGAAPPRPPPGFQERTVRCDVAHRVLSTVLPISVPPMHVCIHGHLEVTDVVYSSVMVRGYVFSRSSCVVVFGPGHVDTSDAIEHSYCFLNQPGCTLGVGAGRTSEGGKRSCNGACTKDHPGRGSC